MKAFYEGGFMKAETVNSGRNVLIRHELKFLLPSIALVCVNAYLIYECQRCMRQSIPLYNDIQKICKEDYIKQLKSFMDEGKDVFIKMKGPNFDECDPIERDKKFAEFSSHPEKYDHYCHLVDEYKRVFDKDGDFEKIINKYNVSLKRLADFYEDRTSLAHGIPTAIAKVAALGLNIYLFIVTFLKKIENPLFDQEQIDEIRDQAAELYEDAFVNQFAAAALTEGRNMAEIFASILSVCFLEPI